MWMATNGMDLGSTSMMIYGFREREMILSFFEKTTGLRMNTNYIRPGGVAADLPDGWEDDVAVICDTIFERTFEYDELLTGQPIFRERTEGVGGADRRGGAGARASPDRCCARPACPGTCAASMPYLAYDEVEFDVIVGTYGDNFDRYAIRLNEIRESIRIVRQMPRDDAGGRLPHPGPQGHAAAARAHRRVDGGADPPLQDLHRGVPGPRGRGLLGDRVAARRARLLHRLGRQRPSRTGCTCARRASSTSRSLPLLLRGGLLSDAVAVISSVDPVMGEVDR